MYRSIPRPPALAAVALAIGGLLFTVFALAMTGSPAESARAIAPCVPHQNTADELELLAMVDDWRVANVPGAGSSTPSDSLNAAAAGYAQYLATNRSASGHFADGSTPWGRAANCGYSSTGSGTAGGEVLGRGATPGEAFAMIMAVAALEQGAGIRTPGTISGFPVKCSGVAKATGQAGTVWIVVLMARSGNCPGAAPASSPTSIFPSATSTSVSATPTSIFPTLTPTRTATTVSSTATSTPTTFPPTLTPTSVPPTATPTPPGSQLPWRLTVPQTARDE